MYKYSQLTATLNIQDTEGSHVGRQASCFDLDWKRKQVTISHRVPTSEFSKDSVKPPAGSELFTLNPRLPNIAYTCYQHSRLLYTVWVLADRYIRWAMIRGAVATRRALALSYRVHIKGRIRKTLKGNTRNATTIQEQHTAKQTCKRMTRHSRGCFIILKQQIITFTTGTQYASVDNHG